MITSPAPTTSNAPTATATAMRERALEASRAAGRWALLHGVPRAVIRSSARKGDLHGRLMMASNDSGELPVALFDDVRRAGPLCRGRFSYATAHMEVVKEVLASPDVHAGVQIGGGGTLARITEWAERTAPLGPLTPPSLLATEPPDHTRMRKLVTRVFSARAVNALTDRVEETADQLLDALPTDRPVDLVEHYCAALPVTMICDILGVPPEDRDTVKAFGGAAAPSLDVGLPWGRFRTIERSLQEFDEWIKDHIENVRRNPGDDLFSRLVAIRDEDGDALSDNELRSTAGLVLAAGFETTVNLIGNGIALLDTHRSQRDLVLADPDLWPGVVDEVLRFDPPVLLTGRNVIRDTEIAGQTLRAGTVIATLLAGANRDPAVFTDPNRFDITRENAGDHISFSAGRHFCLGAALARAEGRVALQKLHERFPDLSVEAGATRRDTRILRGYDVLPVQLTP